MRKNSEFYNSLGNSLLITATLIVDLVYKNNVDYQRLKSFLLYLPGILGAALVYLLLIKRKNPDLYTKTIKATKKDSRLYIFILILFLVALVKREQWNLMWLVSLAWIFLMVDTFYLTLLYEIDGKGRQYLIFFLIFAALFFIDIYRDPNAFTAGGKFFSVHFRDLSTVELPVYNKLYMIPFAYLVYVDIRRMISPIS